MNADDIIMSLPPVYRKTFNQPVEPKPIEVHPNSSSGKLAMVAQALEAEEPAPAPTVDIGNVIGGLTPRGSHVQIYFERYRVRGSIQVPGAGTFYMDFQNILVAEDKLVRAKRDDNDAAFAKLLYRDYIKPMRPIIVDGPTYHAAYKFAGSPIYDKRWFEDVFTGSTFAMPIWDQETMTNLLIIDGSKLYDVVLTENLNMISARAPKWEGRVK